MSPSRRPAGLALGTLLLLLGFAPWSGAQEKLYRPDLSASYIDSSLRVDWYGVYLQNKKIGYVRNERKRVGATIVEDQLMSLKLVSFGKKTEITQQQTLVFQDSAPYRMSRGELRERSGSLDKLTSFRWNDAVKGYDVVHEVGKEKRREVLKDIDFTLADDAATEIWVQQKPKVGTSIKTRQFDPSELKLDVETSTIVSAKQSLAAGVEVHFYEVKTKSSLREIESLSRFDDHGNTLSANIAIFELRKETEEQAKNFEFSQDLFVMGMAKLDKGVGRTDKLRELVLEIDPDQAKAFPTGPRQKVTTDDTGKVRLRLGKKYGTETKATEKEIKEALAETNAYPITHPKIKELADQVTAGAKTDEEKVAKIVRFVHDFVKPYLSANPPYIHDLLEKKRGDCKSYALLVTNLARAAGVPAREVAGLLYVGDDLKAFGGHAWNEVVLNGVWVPVDASLAETEVDAGHICFGSEHRAESNLLNTLGKLSFRLVEVKTAR